MKSNIATLRHLAYCRFQTRWIEPWVLPRVFSKNRAETAALNDISKQIFKSPRPGKHRAWFHAASVGELESLIPVIEKWGDAHGDVLLTIFSESAEKALKKLTEQLIENKVHVAFSGYAPWEGHWRNALIQSNPELFVTAMVEAWPDLWLSLGELEIPLAVVGARERKSFKAARWICSVLGGKLPKMVLLSANLEDENKLKAVFPAAQTGVTGEPRWDRAWRRAEKGNLVAKKRIEDAKGFKKRWGILGSIELADLKIWGPLLKERDGTLWVVPHHVGKTDLAPILEYLRELEIPVQRTSEGLGAGSGVIVVDEVGFLAELYSAADWAYVGGGFGENLHSVLEPAIFGIPIACGPKGAERAAEVKHLAELKQVTLVNTFSELRDWLQNLKEQSEVIKKKWRENVQNELGASDRVFQELQKILS